MILAPLARNAEEPIGSMGNDLALAVLSDQRPLLYRYFKQLFAQVTNPPIDSTREYVVMSVGDERRLRAQPARRDARARPPARDRAADPPQRRARKPAPGRLPDLQGAHARHHLAGRRRARRPRDARSSASVARPTRRSPTASTSSSSPTATSAPTARRSRRCSLSRPCTTTSSAQGTRLQAGLVVESGEPREVHHFATLIGYGAAAVNPYVMLETLDELAETGWLPDEMSAEEAQKRAIKGIAKALLKTISKMGISTIPSYCGAQIFEAVGLEPELVERHFTGTPSRIGGIGLDVLAREALDRHARAYPDGPRRHAPARRRLRLAPRRRAPPVEPRDDRAAPARGAPRRRADLRGVLATRERRRRAQGDAARAARVPLRRGRRHPARARSSPRRRSSSASRPARCRSARSGARRTRRSRSR